MAVRSWRWSAILAFAISSTPEVIAAADIVGRAEKVFDGDTFQVCYETGCTLIRLCGIDAPNLVTRASRPLLLDLIKSLQVNQCAVGRSRKAQYAMVARHAPATAGLSLSVSSTAPMSILPTKWLPAALPATGCAILAGTIRRTTRANNAPNRVQASAR
jgi:hypothetical protein